MGLLGALAVLGRHRHRVQRGPRGGRRHRRLAAVQVPGLGPGRRPADRPGHHPERDQARRRPGLLHALVRRAGQAHRRRDGLPARRDHLSMDGRRAELPVVRHERHRPRRADRGRLDRGRRPSPCRGAWPARCSRRRPARTGPTCGTSAAGRPRSPASPVDVTRTGYTGDLGYELWVESRTGSTLWDAVFAAGRRSASARSGCTPSTCCGSRPGSSSWARSSRASATRSARSRSTRRSSWAWAGWSTCPSRGSSASAR